MDMTNAFPSNYLRVGDLAGKRVPVTMDKVVMETVGEDEKPVLYFKGSEKGLVLNKTNTTTIIDIHGGTSEDWAGNRIVLFPAQTDFQGRQVPCIRIELAEKQVDSEIPF